MLTYLLDTNVCIKYIEFSSSNIRSKLESTGADKIAVCSIVKFEMFYGSRRSSNPSRSLQLQEFFFSNFKSLAFDDEAAEFAATIRADLSAQGQIIGAYDIQIAAIALANDLTLVTNNISEFRRVPGLRFEDWEI